MRLIVATILAAGALMTLDGCGQKGPLVLPPPLPPAQSTAPQPRPADRPFPDLPATNEKK